MCTCSRLRMNCKKLGIMGSRDMTPLQNKTSKCMCGTCNRRMTCRRMRYSLAGVCMEGSRAPHARELFSFIGCRRVASILASTCIFRKDKKNFIKGTVVKNSAPPALTGQQTLDQLNALEPDPERLGYFKGYNSEHAWTHKTCLWDLPN